MKNLVVVFAVFFLVVNGFSAEPTKSKSFSKELVEKNLLIGLNSDNYGLRTSCAFYLGDYKSEKAVIPLLNMLHNEKDPAVRILAALSLMKIGDERGIYAVKKAIIYDDNESVKKMCRKFYEAYMLEENFFNAE